MKILLLDNYDSFTYNLLHYLQIAGAETTVVLNDKTGDEQLQLTGFDAAVLSPGPCTPAEAGNMMEFLKLNAGKKPILGVCLGMQAIGLLYGWNLVKARIPVHGKQSLIHHNSKGIFRGINSPMTAGRYHSLVLEPKDDDSLKVIALCDNEIMAVEDNSNKLTGVQFHPESILTPDGQKLINNWIAGIK